MAARHSSRMGGAGGAQRQVRRRHHSCQQLRREIRPPSLHIRVSKGRQLNAALASCVEVPVSEEGFGRFCCRLA